LGKETGQTYEEHRKNQKLFFTWLNVVEEKENMAESRRKIKVARPLNACKRLKHNMKKEIKI